MIYRFSKPQESFISQEPKPHDSSYIQLNLLPLHLLNVRYITDKTFMYQSWISARVARIYLYGDDNSAWWYDVDHVHVTL